MKRSISIPYGTPELRLRDAANVVAQEDGYAVRAIPSLSSDRATVFVTLRADDGTSFPHTYSAERVLGALAFLPG